MGQGDAAVRTRRDRAAVDTLDERRVPAPVQEQNALFAFADALDEGVVQLLANDDAVLDSSLSHAAVLLRGMPEIDDGNVGETSSTYPVRKLEKRKLARRRVDVTLERRGRAAE